MDILLDLFATAVLVAVSVFDLRERRIPNKIIFPAILVALLTMFIRPGWQNALIGALFGAGFMLLPVVAFGKQGGMGDVKMAFFMGLILGFPGVLFALIIAHMCTLFLWIGVFFKRLDRKSLIPFGPFLAFGSLVIMVLPYLLGGRVTS